VGRIATVVDLSDVGDDEASFDKLKIHLHEAIKKSRREARVSRVPRWSDTAKGRESLWERNRRFLFHEMWRG